MSKEFGERLKQALKEAGYTQKSAGDELGLSKNAMTNYAGGRIPEAFILYRIAKLCSVSMEWLLIGEEQEEEAIPAAPKEAVGGNPTNVGINPKDIELLAKFHQLSERDQGKIEGMIDGLLMAYKGDANPQSRTGTSSRSANGYEREEAAAKSESA